LKYKCSQCNGLFDKEQMATDNTRKNGIKGYCKKCAVKITQKSQRKRQREQKKSKNTKLKKHTHMPTYKGQMKHPPHDESPRNTIRIIYKYAEKKNPVIRNVEKFIGSISLF